MQMVSGLSFYIGKSMVVEETCDVAQYLPAFLHIGIKHAERMG